MGKNDKLGYIRISDEVICICAANASIRTEGVHELSGGFIDNLSKNIRGTDTTTKGIKIDRDENDCTLDVSLICDYDVKIPQVAWDVQVNVKNEVESITGMNVNAVNIHVQGVYIADEEDMND